MKVGLFGDRAILIEEVGSPVSILGEIRSAFPDLRVRAGIDALILESQAPDIALASRLLEVETVVKSSRAVSSNVEVHEVLIDLRYDGPDLQSAADQMQISVEELITRHQRERWHVAMLGFAPGFPYLVPTGSEKWELERLATPRTRVPAGSVAIAAGMSAIYPTSMPGGWLLIGTTNFSLFDATKMPPATLQPGAVVRFRGAS
jgi:KipI family sensor histidine kinase inhibitor